MSANSCCDNGYHVVWTRDEYEMASTLLAAGDTQDASDALTYIFNYEEEASGQVKQNTWLNGNAVFGSNQEDEEADPIILAYQLGRTSSSDFSHIKLLAAWITSNGPSTDEERWEENSGYSPRPSPPRSPGWRAPRTLPASMATAPTEQLAQHRQELGRERGQPDLHHHRPLWERLVLPADHTDGSPNSGASISIANGGGSHDDRTVVDQGFLELVRLGIKQPGATDITNTLAVTDAELGVDTPEGLIDHRYDFDGYGETSTGADYTGSGRATRGRCSPVSSASTTSPTAT